MNERTTNELARARQVNSNSIEFDVNSILFFLFWCSFLVQRKSKKNWIDININSNNNRKWYDLCIFIPYYARLQLNFITMPSSYDCVLCLFLPFATQVNNDHAITHFFFAVCVSLFRSRTSVLIWILRMADDITYLTVAFSSLSYKFYEQFHLKII